MDDRGDRIFQMSNHQLYDQDFYAWTTEQAGLLRAGRLSEADVEHIAEEIESMGSGERRQLVDRLTVLLTQLLRWRCQPALHCTSWRLTLEEQRNRLADQLGDHPNLKSGLGEATVAAYGNAILAAVRETGLERSMFPVACPWPFEQLINPDFYPDRDKLNDDGTS
jgi:hypothetical protein